MKESSQKAFKAFAKAVLVIIFILVIILAVMMSNERSGRDDISPEEQDAVVNTLNEQAAQYPPFVEQRSSLVDRLEAQGQQESEPTSE